MGTAGVDYKLPLIRTSMVNCAGPFKQVRTMAKSKRRRFFVDRRVQGALVLRSVLYWVFCLLTIVVMMIAWRMVTMPILDSGLQGGSLWSEYAPVAVASF